MWLRGAGGGMGRRNMCLTRLRNQTTYGYVEKSELSDIYAGFKSLPYPLNWRLMWQGKMKVLEDANGQKIYIYVPTNYNEAHGAEQYVQIVGGEEMKLKKAEGVK